MKKIRSFRVLALAASSLVFSSLNASAQGLDTGLLNYWPLDDDATDKAGDFSPAGTSVNDGTINGAVTFVPGQTGFGNAGNFPGGGGNNITVPDPDANTNDIDRTGADLTISAWFQLTNRDVSWQALIAHGEGADYRIAIRSDLDPIQYAYAGGGDRSDIQTSTGYGPGTAGDGLWHHVVATTEGSVTNLYIDGVLEATGGTGAIGPSGANNNVLCIGCNPDNGREWNGLIDDVAMWNRALTATEVADIYNAGTTGGALSSLLTDDDDDGDGLPNGWELFYGLDPNDNGENPNNNGVVGDPNNGGDGDPDGDMVANIDELDNGTFPNDDDSDDDTLLDNVETNTNTFVDATDTGTNPLVADTDGDGLSDGVENGSGVFVDATMTGTDPTNTDSDRDVSGTIVGDGIDDKYETDTPGMDPNVVDSSNDLEPDGVDNLTEFTNGTDPNLADTDVDGFSDLVETNDGTFDDLATDTGTDPLNPDTDGDSLLDGDEDNGGVASGTQQGTNPLVVDTDADGTHDGAEVVGGRNPLDATDAVASGLGQKLVAYWNFDNNLDDQAHNLPGESMVADDGMFDGDTALVGYAPTGLFGSSALQLDAVAGVGGFVNVAASVDTLRELDNAVTVSAWVQMNSYDVNWQTILSHGEASQYRLARRNAEETVGWAGGAGDIPAGNVGPVLATGTWHHVVGISDPNGSTEIYINGVSVATGDAPTISNTGDPAEIPNLSIGSNPQRLNREWNGLIDDVAIWGRALSAAEVQEIYATGDGASIEELLGGGSSFQISSITYDSAADEFYVSWPATPGTQYSLIYGRDLATWIGDVDDGIDAANAGGSPEISFANDILTYGPFANPEGLTNTRLFFRVEIPE